MDVREVVIVSGKGGTGKTSLAAAFAALADDVVLADCDVEAPDLEIVLDPRIEADRAFVGGVLAVPEPGACSACGECAEACRFGAIRVGGADGAPGVRHATVDPLACEGCGVCASTCPSGAIRLEPRCDGRWFVSKTRHGSSLVHARLRPGGANSGKLVTRVREEARALAGQEKKALLISDGPPGIGCPVIAALSGADLAVVVAEPSVAAIHDFERLAELIRRFKIPANLCINKYDLNPELAERLEGLAAGFGVAVLGRLPYDPVVTHAQQAGLSVTEYSTNGITRSIRTVWSRVRSRLQNGRPVPSNLEA